MTKRSPLDDSMDNMSDLEARTTLAAVHSPKLDELRASIPKMRTTELLVLLVRPQALQDLLDEDGPYDPRSGPPKHKYTVDEAVLISAAAVLDITDEIDRRIPVPTALFGAEARDERSR